MLAWLSNIFIIFYIGCHNKKSLRGKIIDRQTHRHGKNITSTAHAEGENNNDYCPPTNNFLEWYSFVLFILSLRKVQYPLNSSFDIQIKN